MTITHKCPLDTKNVNLDFALNGEILMDLIDSLEPRFLNSMVVIGVNDDGGRIEYKGGSLFAFERYADNKLLKVQFISKDNHMFYVVEVEDRPPEPEVPEMQTDTALEVDALAELIHRQHLNWWKDPKTGERVVRNKGEMIALMHSELSECLEGVRKDLMDDHLPHHKMEHVELADTVIRILDYCGAYDIKLGTIIQEKLAFNRQRADHKLENRAKDHGKAF